MADKPEWVEKYEAELREYYGEGVRPISHYCNAFVTWRRAIIEALERGDFDWDENVKKRWQEIVDALGTVEIPIRKSNLLWRLIYEGEELRTEKCPEHKGRWSGYGWSTDYYSDDEVRAMGKEPSEFVRYFKPVCECQHGYDLTGWLPVKPPDTPAE